jgi:riboflavin kinase/FMN adenylyltransferase
MKTLRSFAELARLGGPIYATVGFFDGLHRGHQHLIEQLTAAARSASAQSLVITFENSPRNYHRAPEHGDDWRYLTTADEKLTLLATTGVDATLMLPYDEFIAGHTAEQFLKLINSKVPLSGLCVGYDTSIGNDMVRGFQQFSELSRRLGIELIYVEPYRHNGVIIKSSLGRELIMAGEFSALDDILGHRFTLTGVVIAGKGRGAADLSTPTANLLVPLEKITPPEGIYAGLVAIDGEADSWHPASLVLVSQGCLNETVLERESPRPPLPGEESRRLVLEAHLLDYAGDLYGRALTVRFLRRLRDWRGFDSVDDLRAQIAADVAGTIEAVNAASGAGHAPSN